MSPVDARAVNPRKADSRLIYRQRERESSTGQAISSPVPSIVAAATGLLSERLHPGVRRDNQPETGLSSRQSRYTGCIYFEEYLYVEVERRRKTISDAAIRICFDDWGRARHATD